MRRAISNSQADNNGEYGKNKALIDHTPHSTRIDLNSEPYSVQPELSIQCRWKTIAKSGEAPTVHFSCQKKSGVEIRQYPSTEFRNINYKANQKFISSERGNYYALDQLQQFPAHATASHGGICL